MIVLSSFIAELMGPLQLKEEIILNVFENLSKYNITDMVELKSHLENKDIKEEFIQSMDVMLSELIRLKLIELGKIQVEEYKNERIEKRAALIPEVVNTGNKQEFTFEL
jgi:hypothetical protein